MKLLVVEDDARYLKLLVHILEKNKYTVDGVADGVTALEYAMTMEYDGCVFDIMMPGMNGIAVLKRLREQGVSIPILFLSEKADVDQCVEGLNAGADDYLSKPFSIPELLARVRAMLRRKENYVPDLLQCGEMILNRSTHEISCGGIAKPLSGKEFQIMEMLMQRTGCIVSCDQMIEHVWGWEKTVDISAVWMHISNIRKKMAAIDALAQIRFVSSGGYVLEEKYD
ncbi:MAG: response regulator transcription factor [Ruminococcus sp.]|nr:response regulator transcription factor [Ruminococcus sp.]